MAWRLLVRYTGGRSGYLFRQRPRNCRLLSSRQHISRLVPVPRNVVILLGLGGMGGLSLTVIKYFRSDRTSRCQSIAGVCPAQRSVKEFSVFQRMYLTARFFYLCLLFSPALVMYVLSRLLGSTLLANGSWKYALFALESAGPAFVKLGQWASTRRDLFSEDFCRTLSALHIRCTPHSWRDTVKMLEGNFGPDWQESLDIVERDPIGSGCVAQVYQGQLHHPSKDMIGSARPVAADRADSGIPVAIKVLHPNIVWKMEQDIYLMKYMASWVDRLYPDVHYVALTECVDEFTVIMEKQLDLKREARNLSRFKLQMTNYDHIKFPTPIYPYVTSEILVESYESGDQISEYLSNPGGELQKSLAKIGVEVLLDMLFVHNFVHGDLHPGNILVQDPNVKDPRLVLLDCGIATSLEPLDLINLHCVFTAVMKGEGWKVADLFLNKKQTCATLAEYRRKVGMIVDAAVQDLNLRSVRVDTLFSDLFNVMIEHKVRIDPSFTAVMMAIMVIEGLGRSLDPSLDILSYARPCVLHRTSQSVRELVSHRLKEIV